MLQRNISSLYIHVPFCRHLCNYCDFYKSLKQNDSEVDEYFVFLQKSLELHSKKLNKENNYSFGLLDTLYFGGGTPSLLAPKGINQVFEILKKFNINFNQKSEVTLELNPGTIKDDDLLKFKEIGVNRISIGVQSLDNDYLKKLDRIHSSEQALNVIDQISHVFDNFSVDLMLGLPCIKGKRRNLENELNQILKYSPKHISLYILTVHQNYIHKNKLPKDETLEQEYLFVSKYLQENGYVHYEVSNFSKPGFESRHNLNYWGGRTVAAIGPSATGYLLEKKLRYKWKNKSVEYSIEKLTDSEKRLESFYMLFRTNLWVDINDFFKESDLQIILNISKKWKDRGLVEIDGDLLRPTSRGYLIIDSLLDEIFCMTNSL